MKKAFDISKYAATLNQPAPAETRDIETITTEIIQLKNPAFRRLLNQMKLTEPEGPPPQTSEAFAVGRAGRNEAVGGTGKAGPDRSGVFDGEDTSGPEEGEPS